MHANEKFNVLIADRSPSRLVAWQAVLSDLHVNIVSVRSGHDALRCLPDHDFAVILVDVNMPVMDGFETAALIREDCRAASTPIIFISNCGDDPLYAEGYALDGIDYLVTPIVPAIVRRKVSFYVDLQRQKLKVLRQMQALQHRADQLSMLASEVAAVDHRERRQLAQILHDDLQQLLVAARFRLVGHRSGTPEIQARIVAEVDDLLKQSIEASRTLTAELSPLILRDAGLVPALHWLARRMKKLHSLSVAVHNSAAVDLAADSLRSFVFCAVRELLFNCLKHSGVTSATISLTRGADEFVQVTISDDGQGFDPQLLESTELDKDHLGLLSIREQAALMNGEFHITTARGQGTTVVLKIHDPLAPITARQAPIPIEMPVSFVSPPPAVTEIGASIRVLIVDDHRTIRQGIHCVLENEAGIEVVGEAASGLIAIEMMRTLHPDVILMDISMPGMTGIEATRIITLENVDVRIIGLSLHMEEDMAAPMLDAGACAYLSKNGPPDALISTIRQSMAGCAPATMK